MYAATNGPSHHTVIIIFHMVLCSIKLAYIEMLVILIKISYLVHINRCPAEVMKLHIFYNHCSVNFPMFSFMLSCHKQINHLMFISSFSHMQYVVIFQLLASTILLIVTTTELVAWISGNGYFKLWIYFKLIMTHP